jgi:hypothetical protein
VSPAFGVSAASSAVSVWFLSQCLVEEEHWLVSTAVTAVVTCLLRHKFRVCLQVKSM